MMELTCISPEFIYGRDGDAVMKVGIKPDSMGLHSLMVDLPGHNEAVSVHLDTALPRAQAVIATVRAKASERVA